MARRDIRHPHITMSDSSPIPPPRNTAGDDSNSVLRSDVEHSAIATAPPRIRRVRDVAVRLRDPRLIVYQIGAVVAAITLFSMWPAIVHLIGHFGRETSIGVARWAQLVLLVAFMQLAYVAYMVLVPDRSTLRVVTIVSAIVTFGYAVVLGICCADALGWTLTTEKTSGGIRFLELDEQVIRGRASAWCAAVLGLFGLATYLCGRASFFGGHAGGSGRK